MGLRARVLWIQDAAVAGRHARFWKYQDVGVVNFLSLRFHPGHNCGNHGIRD